MNHIAEIQKKNRRNTIVMLVMLMVVLFAAVLCLFAGSSNMSLADAFHALMGKGTAANVRILWKIRQRGTTLPQKEPPSASGSSRWCFVCSFFEFLLYDS